MPELKLVRTLDTNDVFSEAFFSAGRPDLSGLGFPPGAHTLLLNQPRGQVSLVLTAPPTSPTGAMTRTRLAISDSINLAFDSVSRGAKGYGQARLFVSELANEARFYPRTRQWGVGAGEKNNLLLAGHLCK